MAKKTEELSREEKISQNISSFVQVHKSTLIVLVSALVVIVIGVCLFIGISNANKEKAQIRVEALNERYVNFAVSLDSAEYESLVADLKKEIKGTSFTSQKACYILGLTQYANKDYDLAYDSFIQCYELNKKIYLAPLALINAGACKDSAGDLDSALEIYNNVVSEFTESGTTPKALFNIAKIYISQNKYDLAKANLNQLVDEYPYSEYGMLAKNMLIVM